MEIKSSLAHTIRSAYEEFDKFTAEHKITNMCIPLSSIAHNEKNKKSILHRAYPIFYWFYKFLSPTYKEITRKKVKMFSHSSEEKFTEFELKLMRG